MVSKQHPFIFVLFLVTRIPALQNVYILSFCSVRPQNGKFRISCVLEKVRFKLININFNFYVTIFIVLDIHILLYIQMQSYQGKSILILILV